MLGRTACAFTAFIDRIVYSFDPRVAFGGAAGNRSSIPDGGVSGVSEAQASSIAGRFTRRLNSSSRRAEASSRLGGRNRDSARSRMLPSGTCGEFRRPSGPNWKWSRMRGEAKVSRGDATSTSPFSTTSNMCV